MGDGRANDCQNDTDATGTLTRGCRIVSKAMRRMIWKVGIVADTYTSVRLAVPQFRN